jgi:hypothetical protein
MVYRLGSRSSILGRKKAISVLYIIQIQSISCSFSQGVKHPGREAVYSPPSTVEVRNGGVIIPLSIHIHFIVINN